jgi:hypothetical protein
LEPAGGHPRPPAFRKRPLEEKTVYVPDILKRLASTEFATSEAESCRNSS